MTTEECGNDDGGVPNVGNLYICLTTRDFPIIFDREALESYLSMSAHLASVIGEGTTAPQRPHECLTFFPS